MRPKKRAEPLFWTDEVLQVAQQLLSEGQEPCDVADQLSIKRDTLQQSDSCRTLT